VVDPPYANITNRRHNVKNAVVAKFVNTKFKEPNVGNAVGRVFALMVIGRKDVKNARVHRFVNTTEKGADVKNVREGAFVNTKKLGVFVPFVIRMDIWHPMSGGPSDTRLKQKSIRIPLNI
jgi:hypothetical protein